MGTPDWQAGLAAPGSRGTFFDDQSAVSAFRTEESDLDALNAAMAAQGLAPNEYAEYYYEPKSAVISNFVAAPQKASGLTDIPTSTTNYARPRTVAAGWASVKDDEGNIINHEMGTLTVVFRDGTLWNYYDVPRSVWIKFHDAISKGRSFLNPPNRSNPKPGTLLAYPNGPADVSQIDESIRQAIYLAARTKQIYYRNPKSGPAHYQYVYRKQADGSMKRTRIKTYGAAQGPYTGNTNPATNRKIAQAAAAKAAKASKPTPRNTSAQRKK